MPRRLRVQPLGYPLHIIKRGNNRQACFYADEDYQLFLHHLGELAARFKCEIHAYVLMTNHVHLLVTPQMGRGASLLMKLLGQRYVQYVNRTYRRSGTLWDGRFRSSLVQTERYLLGCYRYIELNPVRAGMVRDPLEYRWSSYAANALGKPVTWITPHGEYLALGRDDERRQAAYRGLFEGELDQGLLREIRTSTHGGYAIGNDRFRKDIELALGLRATPRGPGHLPAAVPGRSVQGRESLESDWAAPGHLDPSVSSEECSLQEHDDEAGQFEQPGG
jgi:putative transposase